MYELFPGSQCDVFEKSVEEDLLESSSPEATVRRFSSKKVFLNISQYSQENTCVGVSF